MTCARPSLLRASCSLLAGIIALAMGQTASAQLRLCTWNITNYSSTVPSSRDPDFRNAIYGIVPTGLTPPLILQGKSMSPDILVVQEMLSSSAADNFLTNVLNKTTVVSGIATSPADWARAPFVDGADTDSMFYYRTSKVQYLGMKTIAIGSSSSCNQPRNTYRYDFRPVGYSATAATIAVYSSHLKAQGSNAACPAGENAMGRRLIETTNIRNNAQGIDTNGAGTALPAGYQFISVGDYNVQSATTDTSYVELVGSQSNNTGRFFDPISTPGTWNNSGTYRLVHTQDPATPAASGGMDDRFDFILMSSNLLDSTGNRMSYIGAYPTAYRSVVVPPSGTPIDNTQWNDTNHTYRAYGNDGTSFNDLLTTTQSSNNGATISPPRQNGMVGASIAQSLITSASNGGHLPVLADFRVPPKVYTTPTYNLASPTTINVGTFTVGDTAQASLIVTNASAADIALWNAAGIASLDYTVSVTGAGFSVAPNTLQTNTPGQSRTHTITLNTASPGTFTGTLTISAPSATESTTITFNLTGTVNAVVASCKPNFTGTNPPCLGPVDLLGYLNLYFQNYDGFGSSVPGPGHYAVPCDLAHQSAVPPVVTAAGLQADYDADCQVTTTDLLGYLADYFNPEAGCFAGCGLRPASDVAPAAPVAPVARPRQTQGLSRPMPKN